MNVSGLILQHVQMVYYVEQNTPEGSSTFTALPSNKLKSDYYSSVNANYLVSNDTGKPFVLDWYEVWLVNQEGEVTPISNLGWANYTLLLERAGVPAASKLPNPLKVNDIFSPNRQMINTRGWIDVYGEAWYIGGWTLPPDVFKDRLANGSPAGALLSMPAPSVGNSTLGLPTIAQKNAALKALLNDPKGPNYISAPVDHMLFVKWSVAKGTYTVPTEIVFTDPMASAVVLLPPPRR